MGQKDQGLAGGLRYQAIPRVLIFLRSKGDVLLLKGAATKRIWANLYNGVGGHVEVSEDILSAARREVHEETGISIQDLQLKAVVNIDAGDQNLGIIMFAFVGWCERCETKASHEGELHWLPVESIEDYPLVEDLSWLIPRVLDVPDNAQPLFLHYSYSDKDRLVIRSAADVVM